MQCGAGPQCGDGTIGSALVPAAAGVLPHRLLHEVVFEGDEIGDGFGFRREGRDVVRLEAVDELAHVICLAFYRAEDRPVTDGAVWPEEDEVVWEVCGCDAEVGLGFLGPDILEVCAVGVDDGEARLKGGVEAGCADEDVDGVLVAVVALAASLGDLVDLAVDDVYIVFAQGLEVSHAGRQAATSDVPVWNEALFEVRVLQLFGHLLAEVGFRVIVCGGVLEEDAELAIQAALDVFAVGVEDARLGSEVGTFLGGEDVLLEALDGGDPGWFADEGSYLLDVRLDCGEDLDTGGSGCVSKGSA